jgi:hypothetical protein
MDKLLEALGELHAHLVEFYRVERPDIDSYLLDATDGDVKELTAKVEYLANFIDYVIRTSEEG